MKKCTKNPSKENSSNEIPQYVREYAQLKEQGYSQAFKILHNEADAADAVQSAFLKLIEHWSQFKGESELSSYFYRIVHNECLMMIRKDKAKSNPDRHKQFVNTYKWLLEEQPYVQPNAETLFIEAQYRELAIKTLMGIEFSEDKKRIIEERLKSPYSNKDLADRLGFTESKVKSALHLIRQQFRKQLDPKLAEELELF